MERSAGSADAARCVHEADGKSTRGSWAYQWTSRNESRQRNLFHLATEASPSGTVLVDHQGRIVLVNAHVEKLFGYPRDELIGKMVEILVPERFAQSHAGDRAKFFAAPEARAMGAGRELFARRKDGSEFPVEIGLNPIQTPHGACCSGERCGHLSAPGGGRRSAAQSGAGGTSRAGSACLAR